MNDTVKSKAMSQVTSGRWLLTVTAGACLMAVTLTDCWLAITGKELFVDPAVLLSIVTAVVMSYFGKPADRETPGQPNTKEQGT